MEYTTLRIKKETINQLKEMGKKGESYEDIIQKLIKGREND